MRPGTLVQFPGGAQLALGGIGPERAQRAAEILVKKGVRALLSWGSAGAIVGSLPSGTLIVPQAVVDGQGTRLTVDAAWRTRLLQVLGELPCRDGAVAESAQVLARTEDRARLAKRTGAIAVDMESATIAAVAAHAGLPFLAVRVVADPYERVLPTALLAAIDAYGRVRPLAFARALLGRPWVVADSVRLAQDLRRACATLRRVATLAGPNLQFE